MPEAQKIIDGLKTEQARGALKIAQFYEKKKRWDGALVYYNEVLVVDPNSLTARKPKNGSTPSNSVDAKKTAQK